MNPAGRRAWPSAIGAMWAVFVTVSCGSVARQGEPRASEAPIGSESTSTSTSLAVSAPGAAMWRCDEFKPQYIGGGLTVSVPDAAVGTGSGGSTEDAPTNFGFSAEFAFDGGVVSVGRTIGSDIVPEPGFDKRVENGVVLFVKAADPELRSCVIDTLHYDAVQDEQD